MYNVITPRDGEAIRRVASILREFAEYVVPSGAPGTTQWQWRPHAPGMLHHGSYVGTLACVSAFLLYGGVLLCTSAFPVKIHSLSPTRLLCTGAAARRNTTNFLFIIPVRRPTTLISFGVSARHSRACARLLLRAHSFGYQVHVVVPVSCGHKHSVPHCEPCRCGPHRPSRQTPVRCRHAVLGPLPRRRAARGVGGMRRR